MTTVTITFQYSFDGFNWYNKEMRNKYQESKNIICRLSPNKIQDAC